MAADAISIDDLVDQINKASAIAITRTIKRIIHEHNNNTIQQIIQHPQLDPVKKQKLERSIKELSKPAESTIHVASSILPRIPEDTGQMDYTHIAGTMPYEFYEALNGYNYSKGKFWEGSTGDAFVYNTEQGTYIVKKIKNENTWYGQRTGNATQQKMLKTIATVIHEMNTNLEVTEKIGMYVSKCIGTYVSKHFTETSGNFTAYFVFEYLNGMSLDEWIRQNEHKKTYHAMAQRIKTSLTECISALSLIGYVHRDLKPKNIYVVVNTENEVERCILIDFGEALKIGTPKSFENILSVNKYNTSHMKNNNAFTENERFDPIKANTIKNKFRNKYKGTVIPEQNLVSLNRIITYPTNLGGLGLSEGGFRRILPTKKNNNRRKHHRTRRSS